MQILGIPFRTIPQKRTQLGIPFRATKKRNKPSECRSKPFRGRNQHHFVNLFCCCFVKLFFFRGIPFRSVPFRASESALPRNSECLGMSALFRGITETVPSLFRGIFSERNSVSNPIRGLGVHARLVYTAC
jgi:hypothetical protein